MILLIRSLITDNYNFKDNAKICNLLFPSCNELCINKNKWGHERDRTREVGKERDTEKIMIKKIQAEQNTITSVLKQVNKKALLEHVKVDLAGESSEEEGNEEQSFAASCKCKVNRFSWENDEKNIEWEQCADVLGVVYFSGN